MGIIWKTLNKDIGHPDRPSLPLVLRVLNYDDLELFIIRDIDKLTERRRQKKNVFLRSRSVFIITVSESLRKKI